MDENKRRPPDEEAGSPEAVEVGRRIRRLRRARGLKAYQLGTLAGIKNATYISRVERGVVLPRLTTLAKLARVLGVATSDLLPHEDHIPLSTAFLRSHGLSDGEAEELLSRFREIEDEIRSRRKNEPPQGE